MNARKLKKNGPFFSKNLHFLKVAVRLFEFEEQFMMDTFLFKLTQLEKIGSIGKAGKSDN